MPPAVAGAAGEAWFLACASSICVLRKNCTRCDSSSRAKSRRWRSISTVCSSLAVSMRSYASPKRRIACASSRMPCTRSPSVAASAGSVLLLLFPLAAGSTGSGGNPSEDSDDAADISGDGALRLAVAAAGISGVRLRWGKPTRSAVGTVLRPLGWAAAGLWLLLLLLYVGARRTWRRSKKCQEETGLALSILYFFRKPANFPPDFLLSMSELAALDMCQNRAIFKPMGTQEKEMFKQRCGGSWKLVLRFITVGEACCRREKSQAIAGPGHSIAVTTSGAAYTFGSNNSGQLGHDCLEEEWRPRPIRSLQGIRIIQAAAGAGRTMLVSDAGRVYAFGKDSFGEVEYGNQGSRVVTTPQLVESLKDIYIVQAAIGNFFTAVLSREGCVYTFSWGGDMKLGHQTEPNDVQPHLLAGPLEDIPVVQIAAGYCYLLVLACQPSGMSVYSVGCGLGGKLGHGSRSDEKYPRLIEQFQTLNIQPVVVAAGAWHAAVVGKDGRVCTWGWGRYGCLGHGNEECESVPKVVETLSSVKAVHVATGDYTTFVVSHKGDVYSFGCGESSSLGHNTAIEGNNRHSNVLSPELVTSLQRIDERVVHVSLTNSIYWNAHTFALTESGKLYAFGAGDKGQLGTELVEHRSERGTPEQVDIDLN